MKTRTLLRKIHDTLFKKETARNVDSLYMEGEISVGGLEGTFKEWYSYPHYIRTHTDLGVIKQTTGFNGKSEWTLDTNGQIQLGDSHQIRTAFTTSILGNFSYLLPKKDILVKIKEENENSYILDIKHRRGAKQNLFIDKKTFLPVRHVMHLSNLTFVTTLSSYRNKSGILIPMKRIQETVEQNETVHQKITKVEINTPIDTTLFSPPVTEVTDFSFINHKSTIVPFELFDNHLYLRGRINGRGPYRFLLDTGAGMNVIDKEFAVRIGLKPKGKLKAQGVGGSTDLSIVEIGSLHLKGLKIGKQTGVAIEIKETMEKLSGRRCGVILGYDFLSRFTTKIDYHKKRITFYDPQKFTYRKNWEVLKATYSKIPTIQATVDGKHRGLFRIDTGSGSFVDFHEPYARTKKLTRGRRKIIESEGVGAGGVTKILLTRIKSFTIGSHSIKRPIVGIATNAKGVFGTREVSGNIGNRLLKKFSVIFDYRSSTFGIRKTPAFKKREKNDRSGLLLSKEKRRCFVRAVLPQTPASKTGFKKGDEILSFDRKPVREIPLQRIKRILSGKSGRKVKITIRREEEKKVLSLVLRNYL
jgi:membrane-associated protease RseP (regulator of RpoE activity)